MLTIVIAALIGSGILYPAFAQQTTGGRPGLQDRPPPKDPFAYCRSVKNTQVNFDEQKTPKIISAAMKGWPTLWRCMDGDVYACATDEGGMGTRLCNPVPTTPNDFMREHCVQHPNDSPAMSMQTMGADWECKGKMPVIDIKSAGTLDKHRYRVNVWKKISPAS